MKQTALKTHLGSIKSGATKSRHGVSLEARAEKLQIGEFRRERIALVCDTCGEFVKWASNIEETYVVLFAEETGRRPTFNELYWAKHYDEERWCRAWNIVEEGKMEANRPQTVYKEEDDDLY